MKTGKGFRLKRRRLMAAFVAFLMCFTILVGTGDGGDYVQGAGDSINDGYTSKCVNGDDIRSKNSPLKNNDPNTTSIKITKVDAEDNNSRLGGAEFTLTGASLDTPVVKQTLDATGQLRFDGLLYGETYELDETKAPADYRISENSPWTISVAENGAITITDKSGNATAYTSAGYIIKDEMMKTEIVVTTTFSDNVNDEDKNKVSFQIYAENGTKLADFTYAEMVNGSKNFIYKPGKYTVKETTEGIEGYTITKAYTVDSTVNTKDISKTSYTDAGVAVETEDREKVIIAFNNAFTRDTGNLKITKKFINIDDHSSIDISKLTDSEKAKVVFEIEGPDFYDEIITLKDFSSDRTYTFEGIPVGECIISEDNQLTGIKEYTFVDYVVSYKDGESEIESDYNKVKVTKNSTTEATVTNCYGEKSSVLSVSKTFEGDVSESDKNQVAFEIYDADSKLYAAFTYEDMESGVNVLEVFPGEYTVKEVAKNINGITISKSYEVESTNSDHNQSGTYTADGVTVTLANKEKAEIAFNNNYVRDSGKLEITKAFANGDKVVDISGLTDEEKASVKFTITGPADYETKTISLLDFDSDMKYQETGVPTGNYRVTETGADGLEISGYTFVSSKVEMKDGTAVPDEGAVLAKDETVSFKVTNRYSYKSNKGSLIIKKNVLLGDEEKIDNTKEFIFYVRNKDKGVYYNKVATASEKPQDIKVAAGGTVTIDDLPVGTYEITEVTDKNPLIEGYTYQTTKIETEEKTAAEVTVKDGLTNDPAEVTFTNEYTRDKGYLQIVKSFEDENGIAIDESDIDKSKISFIITGPDGYEETVTYSEFTDGRYLLSNINTGNYSIKETVSDGSIENYTISTKLSTMSKKDVAVTNDTTEGTPEVAELKNVYTHDKGKLKIKKSFSLTKIDGSAANPSLTDEMKDSIKFTVIGPDDYSFVVTYRDFTNGEYEISGLAAGTYSVEETGYDTEKLIENYSFVAGSSDVAVKTDLNVTATNEPVATFKNVYTEDYGYLNISKTVKLDSDSDISNADTNIVDKTFKITVQNADGKYVSTEVDMKNNAVLKENKNDAVISIKNGEDLTLGRLAAGVYTVEEDKDAALAGDSETAGITLEDLFGLDVTGTGEVTVSKENAASDRPAKTEVVNNYLTRKFVKITKTDLEGNKLSGARLQVLADDGETVIDSWTSDKDKDRFVTGLEAGKTYILRETAAPNGYKIPTDSTFSFDDEGRVTVNGTATVTIERKIQTILVKAETTKVGISKVDATSNEELGGATFQILDEDENIVDEWVSTKEAHEVVGLTVGKTYTIRETIAPEGYTIERDEKFELNPDGTVNTVNTTAYTADGVIFVSDSLTSVKISKIDTANGEELEGATFQILDEEGKVVELNGENLEWVSTKEAHEIVGLKTETTYTIRETAAPDGYKVASDTKFELNKDGSINSDKTTTTTDNGILLVNDDMTLVKVSKVDITSEEELEGARIQILDEDENIVDEWVSTKEDYELIGLKAGETYTLRETDAPDGYAIAMNTQFELNADGTINKDKTTAVTDSTGRILVQDKKTSVKISKVDIDNGEELEGATIQILDEEGKVVELNGEKLEWVSTKEAHEVEGLIVGKTYTLRETAAPEGYDVAVDTQFELNLDGTVNTLNTTATIENGVILVEDRMNSIKISKTDISNGEELEGATIQILDEEGKVVELNGEKLEWVSTKKTHVIKGLETKKKYILHEAAAPDGYIVATDTYFELKDDGTVNTDKTTSKVTDERSLVIEDELTNVYISKRDISGEVVLKGAVIQILNADKTIAKDKDGNEIEFTTTEDRFYKVSGLKVDKNYYIHEVKAPEGHKLTADVSFYLNENGQAIFNGATEEVSGNTVMLLKDAVIELNFTKVGRVNEDCSDNPNETTPLEGVEFTAELLDDDGNVQTGEKAYKAVAVSNDMGSVVFNNLPAGDYIIRETATIEAYELSDESYYAHVSDEEDAVFEGLTTDFEGTDKVQNNAVVNDRYKADIKLQTVSEINQSIKLPGSIYELSKEVTDAEGNKNRVVVAKAQTGDDGSLLISGVFAGVEYTLTEIEAPDGYYVSKNPVKLSFKVVQSQEDPTENEVVFDTESFDSGDGTASADENGNITWLEPVTIVRFAKLDEAGNHLSGATLQVVDENGDVVVGPWISTEEDYEVSGLFDANDDKTYKLVEVSAPEGYEAAKAIEFKVNNKKIGPDQNYVITIKMSAKKSKVDPEEPTTEEPTTEEPTTEEPTTEEPTTEEPTTEEPTTEASEELTTEATEEPTTEVSEEPTTEASEEPTTEVSEEPTTEVSEEPTTVEPEKPTIVQHEATNDKPQTGDDSPIIPAVILMIISSIGLLIVGKKKKHNN